MEKKLHLLDTFNAKGSDGKTYKVCGYEHMTRDEALFADGQEHWEPTGITEYRLADGERIDVKPDGTMHIVSSGVTLTVDKA